MNLNCFSSKKDSDWQEFLIWKLKIDEEIDWMFLHTEIQKWRENHVKISHWENKSQTNFFQSKIIRMIIYSKAQIDEINDWQFFRSKAYVCFAIFHSRAKRASRA